MSMLSQLSIPYAEHDEAESVQETIPAAINPGFTEREAVLNSSAWAQDSVIPCFRRCLRYYLLLALLRISYIDSAAR